MTGGGDMRSETPQPMQRIFRAPPGRGHDRADPFSPAGPAPSCSAAGDGRMGPLQAPAEGGDVPSQLDRLEYLEGETETDQEAGQPVDVVVAQVHPGAVTIPAAHP